MWEVFWQLSGLPELCMSATQISILGLLCNVQSSNLCTLTVFLMNCQLDVEILCICIVTAPLYIYMRGVTPIPSSRRPRKEDFPAFAGSVMPVGYLTMGQNCSTELRVLNCLENVSPDISSTMKCGEQKWCSWIIPLSHWKISSTMHKRYLTCRCTGTKFLKYTNLNFELSEVSPKLKIELPATGSYTTSCAQLAQLMACSSRDSPLPHTSYHGRT